MSSFCKCKSYSYFLSKNITVYAIFNDQSFNNTLTNNIVSFEQLGLGLCSPLRELFSIVQRVRFYCTCKHNDMMPRSGTYDEHALLCHGEMKKFKCLDK